MSEDAAEEEYGLTLNGAGISIDQSVDKQTALAVVAAVLGGGAIPVATPAANVAGSSATPLTAAPDAPPPSMREYLNSCNVSTYSEHFAAIGLYLREYRGQETFSRDDLKAGFRGAHEPLPKNFSRDFNNTIKAGWIYESEDSGQFYVTNTATQLVRDGFGRRAS